MNLINEIKQTIDNLREMLEMLSDDKELKDSEYEYYYEQLCNLKDTINKINTE